MRHILSCAMVTLFCGVIPAAEPVPPPHKPGAPVPIWYTAKVANDEDGRIAKITLSGAELPASGIDLKTDVGELTKKLKELAAKHKDKPAALALETDRRLLWGEFVRFLDAATEANFAEVWLVPIGKLER